jgi:hypothetical protein
LIEEAGIEVTGGLSVDFHLLHKLAHLICEGGSGATVCSNTDKPVPIQAVSLGSGCVLP